MNPPLWKYPKPKLYACSRTSLYFGQVHSPPARAHIRVEEDLVDQLFKFERKAPCPHSSSARQFRQRGGSQPVIGKITQDTLAEMVGTDQVTGELFYEQISQNGLH